jgi:hypothetical protein
MRRKLRELQVLVFDSTVLNFDLVGFLVYFTDLSLRAGLVEDYFESWGFIC